MNSRFKELADKVWSLDTEPNPHFEICLQAFAELIVQDCASILRSESERLYQLASEEENEVFAGNFQICAEKCVDNEAMIKQHFGVEDELKN